MSGEIPYLVAIIVFEALLLLGAVRWIWVLSEQVDALSSGIDYRNGEIAIFRDRLAQVRSSHAIEREKLQSQIDNCKKHCSMNRSVYVTTWTPSGGCHQ